MSEGVKEKRLIDCPYYRGGISFAGHQQRQDPVTIVEHADIHVVN